MKGSRGVHYGGREYIYEEVNYLPLVNKRSEGAVEECIKEGENI